MNEVPATLGSAGAEGSSTLSRQQVLTGIAAVSRRHLGYDQPLTEEQRLVEDLGLDSMRAFTLAAEVENYFRIALTEDDEDGLVTVGDLVRVVLARLIAQSGAAPESGPSEEAALEPAP